MKLFVFALLVAAAVAAPIDDNDVVGLIVNGVPDGEAVELAGIVGIKVQEHVDGEVIASTDLLHPLTAVGIAEAAAAAATEDKMPIAMSPEDSDVIPEAASLPAPALPEVVPAPVILPAPAQPEVNPAPVALPAPVGPEVQVPEAVVLPAPVGPEVQVPEAVVLPAPVGPEVQVPEAVVLPAPVEPEVAIIPEAVILPAPVAPEVQELPEPSAQNIGEIFNDGTVQVTVNAPETGIISTIQGWFSMVMNYISDGSVQTQQIV